MTEVMMDGDATLLDKLPLDRHEITAARRRWRIEAVRDQSALLGISEGLAEFPFGLLLWESAIALADAVDVLVRPDAGMRVLEIGAGTGLAGLAAASAGASLVQTDHSTEALALCRSNARLNDISEVVFDLADWRNWKDDRLYDLVIGADVLYDAEAHPLVLAILERNVAPGGRALLADPQRLHTAGFTAMTRERGWKAEKTTVEVPAVTPLRPGQTVKIDLIGFERGP